MSWYIVLTSPLLVSAAGSSSRRCVSVVTTCRFLLDSPRRNEIAVFSETRYIQVEKGTRPSKVGNDRQKYDHVSIGYPGPVVHGRPLREPHNLAAGWVGFDFVKAFGCPVKVVNDAAMQALGSCQGGSMLFLGLGSGLGSAMIVDGILEQMELAHLPYTNGKTYEDSIGIRGLKRSGNKIWERHVTDVVERLKNALCVDYVVLGGGNSNNVTTLPPDTCLGDNRNAFAGGLRLWAQKRKVT